MVSFSPEYQGMPVGWTPPESLPPFKKIPPDIIKEAHNSVKTRAFLPESKAYQGLGQRATVLSSSLGGVVALTISQMINPGLNIGNIGLLGIGVLLGCKIARPFLNSKLQQFHQESLVLTKNDMDVMLGEALNNPIFSFIYRKVNEQVPLKLFLKSSSSHPQSHSFSHYKYLFKENRLVDHSIGINDKLSPEQAFEAFIFEFVNAYQIDRVEAISLAAKEGKIGKEDYAICCELIELHTQILTDEILSHGKRYLNWQIKEDPTGIKSIYIESVKRQVPMLDIAWMIENALLPGCTTSHADIYRLQWERLSPQS